MYIYHRLQGHSSGESRYEKCVASCAVQAKPTCMHAQQITMPQIMATAAVQTLGTDLIGAVLARIWQVYRSTEGCT